MDHTIQWVIGIGISTAATLAGAIIVAFYRVSDAMRNADNMLHERINAIKDDYVRRVDLDKHLDHFDSAIKELKQDMKEQHTDIKHTLDRVLNRIEHQLPERNG